MGICLCEILAGAPTCAAGALEPRREEFFKKLLDEICLCPTTNYNHDCKKCKNLECAIDDIGSRRALYEKVFVAWWLSIQTPALAAVSRQFRSGGDRYGAWRVGKLAIRLHLDNGFEIKKREGASEVTIRLPTLSRAELRAREHIAHGFWEALWLCRKGNAGTNNVATFIWGRKRDRKILEVHFLNGLESLNLGHIQEIRWADGRIKVTIPIELDERSAVLEFLGALAAQVVAPAEKSLFRQMLREGSLGDSGAGASGASAGASGASAGASGASAGASAGTSGASAGAPEGSSGSAPPTEGGAK